LPFASLVTVLLAAPLAIHFSRRGPGGGIFLAVVLSALMLLTSNIVLAFGEAGLIQPVAAAWLPNIIFGTLAIYLFHRRITGRPIYHTLRRFLPGGA
jgi:lipopolysaccharide export system permease protein